MAAFYRIYLSARCDPPQKHKKHPESAPPHKPAIPARKRHHLRLVSSRNPHRTLFCIEPTYLLVPFLGIKLRLQMLI
jgi:hypothetical protein